MLPWWSSGPAALAELRLHPHIVGAPIVAYWFEKALNIHQQHRDTPFMTFGEIGDWFIETDSTKRADVA